ncbi:MAG: glycine--tRNA ligase subunit beta, partial [candidate division WOR-3 bacterium]|nr:glycine--tRNA ligase subunit beta [candidate division WOR-3 bacterium]
MQFPKTMRWQENKLRFARPIRWLCIVYGNKPISVKIDSIKSSAYTYGHRNFSKKRVKITNIRKYKELLKKYQVLVDANERKTNIKRQMSQLANKVKGEVVIDEELLDEITNICEMPVAILCRFKSEFLSLPAPVLITTLKTHTRSFAVQDKKSHQLKPYFISVVNTFNCDRNQVRYWYERAVASRLEDAQFYFNEDIKIGLEKRVEEEKKVIWIEGLGTLFEKTARLEKLVLVIAQRMPAVNLNSLLKAAYLCKSDLLTNMVREKEYTSLQGIMGGIYAKLAGESDLVAQIISEHYLPKGLSDNLPQTIEGSILSIADKIDNIVGAFIIGEIPSGSLDPFGLKRQALAIGSICLNKQLNFDLSEIIDLNLEYFNRQNDAKLSLSLHEFFKERINTLLLDQNIRYDIINAVLALKSLNIFDCYLRVKALTEFRQQKEFEPLVIGQKRVNNIIRDLKQSLVISESLLQTPAEQQLYQMAKSIEEDLLLAISQQDYLKALKLLLSLRPAIDNLFDQVL